MIPRTHWSEFAFMLLLAAAALVALTTLAAIPKAPPSETAMTAPIFQPVLQKVY